MKLVLTLLVRDEADIIDAQMAYHLAQGVDFILVTDNCSTDGTTDIVRRYERAGVARLIHEPDDNYAQGKWVTRMARMARAEYGADWVINGDADEFWWPESGDLKSTFASLPQEAGILKVPRVNFVPVADDGRPFHDRMVVREVQSLNAVGRPLRPKVCHRGHPDVIVHQGNHRVSGCDLVPFEGASPVLILHFPLRTYRQFERKIVNGGRAYQRSTDLPPSAGRTWRNLYQRYEEGELPSYYAGQELSPAAMEEGLKAGRYVVDERLRLALRALRHETDGRTEPSPPS